MNTRYKITRLDKEGNPTLSLEECQNFFKAKSDFEYNDSFGSSKDGVHMKIKGHFFMWQVENVQIPFRFFEGEIYVAISHPAILDKTMEIARGLEANYVEG
ncbi:excinuclease [Lysinibacillus sp. 2017]|uniref:excinuclease n=1 Tax=unclassified Lysinibacillus TaxID=2636778 RepID=UPI000D52687B|nr:MULTISPECIES: excinuclease [unclassified Lysinibacillus]AWE08555.1 excinuclease [Lysinibacillus sp. 2017]TGN35645.1 excinuclease [Lysinibacillus sp. S2017]